MPNEPRAVPLDDLSSADGAVHGCVAIANAALRQAGSHGVVHVPYRVRGSAPSYSLCSWLAASGGERRWSGRLCLISAAENVMVIGASEGHFDDGVLSVLPASHLLSSCLLFDGLVSVLKAHGRTLFRSAPTQVQDCNVLTVDSVREAFVEAGLFQPEELVLKLSMFHGDGRLCDAVWTRDVDERDVFNAWWQAVSIAK